MLLLEGSTYIMKILYILLESRCFAMRCKKLLLMSIVILLVAAACGPQRSPVPVSTRTPHPKAVIETLLTAAERAEIFETVWQTINDEYFDPTFGGLDWQAIGEEYRQKLATVQDDDTFWRQVLNPMLFELGVSHLAALPPGLAKLLDPMTFAAGSLGMDIRLLDGKAVVTQVIQGSPAAQAGLLPGFVIISVDGWTLEDFAAQAIQMPPDNDRNRRATAVQDLRALLFGETGKSVVVEYLDSQDHPERLTLQYATRQDSACVRFDPSLPPACAEVEVRRLPGEIGYLRFSGFLNAALEGVLAAISDLSDTPALIIDLRGNPGGLFPVRKAIASHLVGTPELFIRYQHRDGLEEAYLDPVPAAYTGQVVILVDELSASSSEEFAGSLQALERAKIAGSQTPGRCLTANIVPLPKGAILVYPFGQSQTPDGRVLEDNGVIPDLSVTLDRQQLLQGVDAQLEAAIQYLAK